jgi:hypothetical protein
MLNLGDTVEEIATKRVGKIDNMSIDHLADGTQKVNYWRVLFNDGQAPVIQIFKDAAALGLVSSGSGPADPGLSPERGIMG